MKNIRFHKEVITTIRSIWRYSYFKFGKTQADKYILNLNNNILKISKDIIKGRLFNPLKEELSIYYTLSQKHYIFYMEKPKYIYILAILHNSMDLNQRIKDMLEGNHF